MAATKRINYFGQEIPDAGFSPGGASSNSNQMGSDPTLYSAHGQTGGKIDRSQQDPMAMIGQILTALMNKNEDPLARGKNNAATITALRNDPQGDHNKAYMPGVMPGQPGAESNPFTNGFFKTGDQRHAVEASRGPIPWADPATPMPFSDFGTPTHSTPFVPPPPRNNPFDDPSMTGPDGNPLHPQQEHPFMGLLKSMFGHS